MTDWSKVLEVFGSGIIGVFMVMFLLQILTQLSTRVIDFVENMGKDNAVVQAQQKAVAKEKA